MRLFFALLVLLGAWLPAGSVAAAPSPQGSASEVIALINGYRAENGLPAYSQNPILAQIAQGQADWLISQGMGGVSDVHAGPGGTRPIDRAYAAGYGGGKTIFISEIVKGGYNETPQDALAWWKNSPNHNPTMIASTYQEIGAGAATDGNGRWYYVAVTGWVTGTDYSGSSGSSGAAAATTAPQAVMIPVTIADPQADGSVKHIVRTGQTLWTIAAVYAVPLDELLALNNLPEWAYVYPGDELLVKPAGSMPTATSTPPEASQTPSAPAPTEAASATPEGAATLPPPTSAPTAAADLAAEARQANSSVFLIVGGALVAIVGIFGASFFVRRPRPPQPDDNDPFAPID